MLKRTASQHSEAVLKALSIRRSWARLILHGGKDIENRDWRPRSPGLRFRGTRLVHASRKREPLDTELREWVIRMRGTEIPQPNEFPRGGIVGQVDIVDVVRESTSPWFSSPWDLVLGKAELLAFVACLGRLGFFEPLIEVSAAA
jgi:hypothetical protein